jgi:hypothetical protein
VRDGGSHTNVSRQRRFVNVLLHGSRSRLAIAAQQRQGQRLRRAAARHVFLFPGNHPAGTRVHAAESQPRRDSQQQQQQKEGKGKNNNQKHMYM